MLFSVHATRSVPASRFRPTLLLMVAAALAVSGCSDAPTRSARLEPRVTLTAERSLTDTVLAGWVQLTATVVDGDGRPMPGIEIFLGGNWPGPTAFWYRVPGPNGTLFQITDTTDAAGRVEAFVQHGWQAGEAWATAHMLYRRDTAVVVLGDSLLVKTTPGQIATISISPSDTALYQGNSAEITATTADVHGNPRTERAELEPASSGLSVNGNSITATAGPSRQRFRARYGDIVDSAWISIVPHGEIAIRVMRLDAPDEQYAFATMELDGSGYTLLLDKSTPGSFGRNDKHMGIEWGHDGEYLLFFDGYPNNQLYTMLVDGTPALLFPTTLADHFAWQQETLDGSWLYFEAITLASYETYIYRAHRDGSEMSRVSPETPAPYQNDLYPSPSPDGKSVVYATDREHLGAGDLRIHVLDVATGTDRSLGVSGTGPRWSPTGEWIAFGWDNKLYVIRPDGSGLRRVSGSEPNDLYEPWTSWSPDGKWLVAEHLGPYIEVIGVENGEQLPLLFTGSLATPTWRPID
ncbi:MAG TPA: hypothetical protein VIR34_11615 [Gemmatimonadaceae bacterium]